MRGKKSIRKKGFAGVWAPRKVNCPWAPQTKTAFKNSAGARIKSVHTHRETCVTHTYAHTELIQKTAERKKQISPGHIACFTANYQRLRAMTLKMPFLH